MGVSAKGPYYRGVRGSAALATVPLAHAAPAAEALEPGEMRRLPFAGELLGAVRVRSAFAALPLDAFDRACAALEAEEQAAYLQLLRLSLGEGRNFCRVAKRDLMARLRLSERRLLRVLDAVVAKGFARPLHRDNRGTLWRVSLPCEAFGEPPGDDVIVGRAGQLRVVDPPSAVSAAPPHGPFSLSAAAPQGPFALSVAAPQAPRSRRARSRRATPTPTPTPIPRPGRTGPRPVHTEVSLARALAVARGRTAPEDLVAAAREIGELLAEGQTPDRIAASIETVRRRAARATAPEERP